MKKLLLIVALLFSVVMVNAQSSTFYQSYKVTTGKWNEYREEYVYAQPVYETIKLEFNKTMVRVYDRVGSVYITRNYRQVVDTDKLKMHAWDATDEASRNCRLTMAYSPGSNEATLSVLYGDMIYQYTYRLLKLD